MTDDDVLYVGKFRDIHTPFLMSRNKPVDYATAIPEVIEVLCEQWLVLGDVWSVFEVQYSSDRAHQFLADYKTKIQWHTQSLGTLRDTRDVLGPECYRIRNPQHELRIIIRIYWKDTQSSDTQHQHQCIPGVQVHLYDHDQQLYLTKTFQQHTIQNDLIFNWIKEMLTIEPPVLLIQQLITTSINLFNT